MHQADQSVHKNLAFQLSDRQSAQKSSRNDHQQSNPQGTIDSTIQYESTNHYQSTNQQSDNKSNNEQIRHILGKQLERPRSKILLKQKDRYQNKSIQKGMFNNQQQSVNELKVVYKGSNSQLLSKDQSDSKIKRKPLKLSPIKNISGVQLLSKKQLNKTSELELPQKFERTTLQLPVRVKQIANFHQFVKQAMPVSKKLIGVLKRDRSGSKRLFPLLSLYMNQQLKYLLGSKRKACNLNSTYHIGTGNQPATQQDQEYVGTLKGNFLGTQFNFYDNSNNQKQILATISFINQISCKTVPRQIQVYVLSPFYKFGDLQGADTTNAHLKLKDLYVIGQNKQNRKILKFVNKKPIYDQARDQYFMDFHGKAQYSSVKNMILVDAENQNKEVFLIGKAGQDVFNFDAMFPLSPRIALAIASTSFDWKWASQ